MRINIYYKILGHWIYNLINKNENTECILILSDRKGERFFQEVKNNIEEKLSNKIESDVEYNIFSVEEWIKNKETDNKKNTILIGNNMTSISYFKNFKESVLCIYYSHNNNQNSINKDFKHLDINKYSKKPKINDNDIFSFYIEEKNPLTIIDQSVDQIENFLFNYLGSEFIKETSIRNLLKDTNLYAGDITLKEKETNLIIVNKGIKNTQNSDSLIIEDTFHREYLKRDICILKEKNILTARLGIALYRKALLEINANITQIGRYFSKELHNKSKSIDLKKISIDTSTNYDGLSKTIVKGYIIGIEVKSEEENRNQLELEIKEHIAKKLLYFTDIDIGTIQRIVELPQSTLKKYR